MLFNLEGALVLAMIEKQLNSFYDTLEIALTLKS